MGCVAIEDFADRAQASVLQVVGHRFEHAQGQVTIAMATPVGQGEGPQQPAPDGALVVAAVPFAGPTAVVAGIGRIGWAEAAEAMGAEQLAGADAHHAPLLFQLEPALRQGDGEDLIGSDAGVVAAGVARLLGVGVDHIEAASLRRIPEPLETAPHPLRQVLPAVGGPADPSTEVGHGGQGIEPKGIDLHRLAATGGDHPPGGDRIHPGELHAAGAAGQQSIGRIDADVVAGAVDVMLQHRHQAVVQLLHQSEISAGGHVLAQGLEIPEGGIHGVEVLLPQGTAQLRKAVGQHAAVEGGGEGQQQVAGDRQPAGADRQPRQAEQGVPSPVLEPVISGDHRGGRACGCGAGRHQAAHEKLIRRQHQLADPGRCWRHGRAGALAPLAEQPTLMLQAPLPGGIAIGLRLFAGAGLRAETAGPQHELVAYRQGDGELQDLEVAVRGAEAPLQLPRQQIALIHQGAGLNGQVTGTGQQAGPGQQLQGGRVALVALHQHAASHGRGPQVAGTVAAMETALVHQGADAQPHRRLGPQQPIAHVGDVGPLLHPEGALDLQVIAAEQPARQTLNQFEPLQPAGRVGAVAAALPDVAGELQAHAAVLFDRLVEVAEQEAPIAGRSDGSHQKAVVTAGEGAADAGAGIAAQPIGDQPFAAIAERRVTAHIAAEGDGWRLVDQRGSCHGTNERSELMLGAKK